MTQSGELAGTVAAGRLPTGELGRTYLEAQAAVRGLIAGDGDHAGSTVVGACAPWTVRDVLAHLTGVADDVLRGNIAGAATDAWTAAQVNARADRTAAEIVAEWDELSGPFAAMLDDFPGWYGNQVVADLAIHEHDIRGALDRPGDRDAESLLRCVDYLLCVRAHPAAAVAGIGPVRCETERGSWIIGSAEPVAANVDAMIDAITVGGTRPAVDAPAAVTLRATAFDLSRALSGRRSETQLRRLDWNADANPFLPLFGSPPFSIRATDLDE